MLRVLCQLLFGFGEIFTIGWRIFSSTNQRMIAPLAKFLDWYAIQVLTIRLRDNGRNPRLGEALQFLKGPDFIPAESQPARVEFNHDNSGLHFRFPTPRPCGFAENNVAYGRLYRCAERWQERPVIILLHGGGGFPDHPLRRTLSTFPVE